MTEITNKTVLVTNNLRKEARDNPNISELRRIKLSWHHARVLKTCTELLCTRASQVFNMHSCGGCDMPVARTSHPMKTLEGRVPLQLQFACQPGTISRHLQHFNEQYLVFSSCSCYIELCSLCFHLIYYMTLLFAEVKLSYLMLSYLILSYHLKLKKRIHTAARTQDCCIGSFYNIFIYNINTVYNKGQSETTIASITKSI